jgi:hypothetical protein
MLPNSFTVKVSPDTNEVEVPAFGITTRLLACAGAATPTSADAATAIDAPSARPLRVMFLVMYLSFFLVSRNSREHGV